MSFPKAKLQRFNEVKDCTPSPAKYNVAVQDKIKLGVISQSGSYVKKATSSLSGSETASVHSTPCFQTPVVPKKKKFLGISAFKTKSATTAATTKDSNIDPEELREKIVECANKDGTIKDLREQIEEMKESISILEKEKNALMSENKQYAENMLLLKKQQEDLYSKHLQIQVQVKEINSELRMINQQNESLKRETVSTFIRLKEYVDQFQHLHHETIKEKEEEALRKQKKIQQLFEEDMESLKKQMNKKIEERNNQLKESEAKLKLVEENFKEVSLLTEMQMKEKLEEVEAVWKFKLEEKEKESDAILKECQAISEYNIIQSEIEKNQLRNLLTENDKVYNDTLAKLKALEVKHDETVEELSTIKSEKHAYELSITTFRDTIEVLKKRLFESDRDVEQLKEELNNCEERVLKYEKKISELTNQLDETRNANEELEMQYESTSKIMQNQVKSVEKALLNKVEGLQGELKQLLRDKELLNEVLAHYHEQQTLISKAQESIVQSSALIETLESRQSELEKELNETKIKLAEEAEEAAAIRKKYIDISGKYDKLSQEFSEVSLELEKIKTKNEELQNLIGPYQEQLEAYDHEMKIIMNEKESLANETKELTKKYADILGHQNHQQKIRHLTDLKVKSTELFEKNLELESRNYKLTKTIEKLKKEVDELRKAGGNKKLKLNNGDKENMSSPKCPKSVQSPGHLKDKENMGSPKCLKGVQSPGPLKDKNSSMV